MIKVLSNSFTFKSVFRSFQVFQHFWSLSVCRSISKKTPKRFFANWTMMNKHMQFYTDASGQFYHLKAGLHGTIPTARRYRSPNRTCVLTSNLRPIREMKVGSTQKLCCSTTDSYWYVSQLTICAPILSSHDRADKTSRVNWPGLKLNLSFSRRCDTTCQITLANKSIVLTCISLPCRLSRG